VRRVGVLMPFAETDPMGKLRLSAFTQALAGLGWTDGCHGWKVELESRWQQEAFYHHFTGYSLSTFHSASR
jgi:hypothetical protein